MGSVQGVRQLGPSEVFASAPGGCDSNCKSAEFDTGLKKSTSEKDVHAASISAAATNAALRPMSLYRTAPSPSRIFPTWAIVDIHAPLPWEPYERRASGA